MKISKIMTAGQNGQRVRIISDALTLDLHAPGRGIFCVEAGAVKKGDPVTYSAGCGLETERMFTGYAAEVKRIDRVQWRVMARDYSGLLELRCPFAQRNTDGLRVLREIHDRIGVAFRLGASVEAKFREPVSHFFNLHSAASAVDTLGLHLGIEDFICRCEPSGEIFVGTGRDIRNGSEVLGIPAQFFTEKTVTEAVCPLLPALRPGRRIRIGDGDTFRVEQIQISGMQMRLTFEREP